MQIFEDETGALLLINVFLGICVFLQGSSDQSAYLSQHPGAAVSGWQHLHHLLCGGPFSETRAGEAGADAVGEE